jgi:hypothetical protein
MATSGTVTATDNILAQQYNDLRTDVLATHTHDGTDGNASLGGALSKALTQARVRDAALKVANPAQTAEYTLRSSAITANRDVTLPLLTGNDTVVFENHAQPLAGKTLSQLGNTRVKTADEVVNNSTALQNDDHLTGWSLDANSRYMLTGLLRVVAGSISDLKFSLSGPSGMTYTGVVINDHGAAGNAGHFDESTSGVISGVDAVRGHSLVATVLTGGNAGTLTLQWAQNSAESYNTALKDGSWVMVVKL